MTSTPAVATGWRKWLPGVATAQTYQRSWLSRDLIAGLVLTAMLVPQGMAYAELAGLPAVTGLYTTVLSLLAYALFGPSRIMVLGPDSSLAPLIVAIIVPLTTADDPAEAVALAGALAIFTGLICIGAGLLRLGAITELLSRPVRVGYINGIALIVLVSQLPKLFGFSVDADGFIDETLAFFEGVFDGMTDLTTLTLGVMSLAFILGFRRWIPRVPGVLVAVVVTTLLVSLFDLDVSVVGSLPQGFPSPELPNVDRSDLGPLLAGALTIALVAFADTGALSATFAARRNEEVDPNQEIIALGTANIGAGFFRGFPTSASSSRTAVAESIGSRTQLTGVIGAVAITLLLVFANDLLANLPSATLAAIVIVASLSLFDVKTMRWLAKVRKTDLLLSLAALLGVTLVGVFEGLVIAIGLSLAVFVWRTWRPYSAVLGRIEGVKGYHDVDRHPDAVRIPGLVIFRWDAPLFFANAAEFERRINHEIFNPPEPIQWVTVAAEPMTDVDSTGAEFLEQVLDSCDRNGIRLSFAELKGPTKDRLRRYGLYQRIGQRYFFPTLGTAIDAYVDETGAEWLDWTDR